MVINIAWSTKVKFLFSEADNRINLLKLETCWKKVQFLAALITFVEQSPSLCNFHHANQQKLLSCDIKKFSEGNLKPSLNGFCAHVYDRYIIFVKPSKFS